MLCYFLGDFLSLIAELSKFVFIRGDVADLFGGQAIDCLVHLRLDGRNLCEIRTD